MQILGLLGMYFDAVVVEVKTFLLLFRLALAILWFPTCSLQKTNFPGSIHSFVYFYSILQKEQKLK